VARSARSKGLKDPAYRKWITSLPCVVCLFHPVSQSKGYSFVVQTTQSEAAHVGDRGLSQKCSDRLTIPLCRRHHRIGPEAHHVLGKNFWEHHGLDRDALITELNARYENEKSA
jgi:hypothetical protein